MIADAFSEHLVISGRMLYEMVHSGPGTWSMDRAHDAARDQSATQQRINQKITAIANDLEQAWSGQAAEGAHGATQPLRDGATISSESLHNAQNVHAGQGQHFSTIHREMEPLESDPPQTNILDSVTPWDTDTEQAVQKYNNASSRNVELYQAYGKTTDSSVGSMPQRYGAYPQFDGEFSVADNSGSSSSGPSGFGTSAASFASPVAAGGVQAAPSGSPNVPAPHLANQPYQPSQPHSIPQPHQPVAGTGPVTGANPASPPATGTPGTPGATGVPPRTGLAGGIAAVPPSGTTSGDIARSPRGAAGNRAATSGRGGAPGRFGPGSTGRAPSTGTRFGPSAPGEGAAGARPGAPGRVGMPGEPAGPGARTGAATPGAAAAAEAAARGGTSPTARPGAAGAPVAPGARGKGDEDEEHQRKTLLEEPDAEGLFGTDQPTAPPVIGDGPNS